MIETFRTLIAYTFKEHIRHRLYLSLFLFGFILLMGGLVISALAVEQRGRMMLDLGFSAIEFLGLTTIVFVSVNLVLSEIENRTIYLVVSRPLARWQYIVARFIGTTLAVALSMAVMALLHAVLLLPYTGVISASTYVMAWLCSVAKLTVVGSLALALSLLTTSAPTAMTFTFFLWAIGHFSQEVRFLGEKSAHMGVKALVWFFYHVAPDFSYFNYRDFFYTATPPTWAWGLSLGVYAFSYTAICLWIASVVFSKREF